MGTATTSAAATRTGFNPYLDAFDELLATETHDAVKERRWALAHRYAWAIPNADAIAAIVETGPVIELGAGAGYWAALTAAAGGDIVAFDQRPAPSGDNEFTDAHEWYPVDLGGVDALDGHHDRALLLCWPPLRSTFAADALAAYRGDTLIYIGEGPYGCCGTDDFFDARRDEWRLDRHVAIPRWPDIGDRFEIWTRR